MRLLRGGGAPPARQLLRGVLVLAALASCAVAVGSQGGKIRDALGQLSAGRLVLAACAVLVASVATMLSWRCILADLGSPLRLRPAARVFFVSQLGKYLPGSVWPVLAQVELGRDLRVPPGRSAVVAVITLAIGVTTGLLVAAATLPLAEPHALRAYAWAFLVVPLLLVLLHPRVLNPLLSRLFRLARRTPPTDRLTAAGIATAAGWALVAWLAYGLQLAVLVQDLKATPSSLVLLAVGAFSLAWTVGFLVVVAPAGAGVREAVLVLTLSPVLPAAAALLVALVSRVLLTFADLGLAGVAVVLERRRLRRLRRPDVAVAGTGPNSGR